MPVHRQVADFLGLYYQFNPPTRAGMPPELVRQQLLAAIEIPPDCPTPARSVDRVFPGRSGDVRIRIHTPPGSTPFGCCLYFHGGGWVLGSIETHDDLVRRLVDLSGCVFVSVDYPLAPEHKFPIAVEDSLLAVQWVTEHALELGVDSARIAVAGDSAGANIAAALCLMARDRHGPRIAHQVLIYPITDCDFERPSYRENADGYFLCRRDMEWFWNHYTSSPEQRTDPYASPLRAASLAGLPPAYVLTAEFDPLRDEGLAYAQALQQAGVQTTLREFPGMIHGFVKRWENFDDARTVTREIGSHLRRAIGPESANNS